MHNVNFVYIIIERLYYITSEFSRWNLPRVPLMRWIRFEFDSTAVRLLVKGH